MPTLNARNIAKGFSHYPWDYMLFIFVAWAVPALYGLLNRYFIGYMTYESVVTEQSFESLEVLMEVFLAGSENSGTIDSRNSGTFKGGPEWGKSWSSGRSRLTLRLVPTALLE